MTPAENKAAALYTANIWLATITVIAMLVCLGAAGLAWLTRQQPVQLEPSAADAPTGGIDSLTDLPDQETFLVLLEKALSDAQLSGSGGVTVLAISLKGFEAAAAAHGADGCQQLLVAAAKRLRRVIREVDVVAKLGENEFGVLLHDITNRPDVLVATERVAGVLGRDFRLQTGVTSVSANIGIALGQPDGDPYAIVDQARTAMRRAGSTDGAAPSPDPATAPAMAPPAIDRCVR